MTVDFTTIMVFGNTFLMGVLGYFVRAKFEEVDKVRTLLNTTREQIARDHATREEVTRAVERLGDRVERRLDDLTKKIDHLSEKQS